LTVQILEDFKGCFDQPKSCATRVIRPVFEAIFGHTEIYSLTRLVFMPEMIEKFQ